MTDQKKLSREEIETIKLLDLTNAEVKLLSHIAAVEAESKEWKVDSKHQKTRADAALAMCDTLKSELQAVKESLKEFSNHDNWLYESEALDRGVKSGNHDWVYIGKWNPMVFAHYASEGKTIDGTRLELTKKEERSPLSSFYKPDEKITTLAQERDQLREKLRVAVGIFSDHDKELLENGGGLTGNGLLFSRRRCNEILEALAKIGDVK